MTTALEQRILLTLSASREAIITTELWEYKTVKARTGTWDLQQLLYTIEPTEDQAKEFLAWLWGELGLPNNVEVVFSNRRRKRSAFAEYGHGNVGWRIVVPAASTGFLDFQIVCHEAAHIASRRLLVGKMRPHGSEFVDFLDRIATMCYCWVLEEDASKA